MLTRIKKILSKKLTLKKCASSFFIFSLLQAQALQLPLLVLDTYFPQSSLTKKLDKQADVPVVSADYQYSTSSQNIVTSNATVGDYINTQLSDGVYHRILSTTSGVDVQYTISGVRLFDANRIIVKYDGSVSSATLTYQIQIRDHTNSTWRNILPHEATYTNTADSGTGLVLATATTGALSGGYFDIYDGYFSNGSNTPISTPLSNFVDTSGNVQIRFLSSATTANLELRVDYLAVEAANSPQYLPTSITNSAGGTLTNEYTDVTSDDNTTNLQIAANGSGIDAYFSMNGVALPYTDANTYLIEFSGFRTTITNFSIYMRDFANTQWDLVSATALTHTADRTDYFALVPSTLSQNMSDYISGGEVRIRVTSAQTSGSITVDFVRLTLGSTATNTGIYTGTITRGSTSTGTVANTRTIDTSAADSAWVINTSITDARTTTELGGDCNAPTTNHCVSGYITVPITVPDNSVVQEVLDVVRFNTSNASLDLTWDIRNYSNAWTNGSVAPATQTTATTMIRQFSNAMPPQIGAGPLTSIPTFTPARLVDDVNNAAAVRFRTTASNTTAYTATVDFIFATIKTIKPLNQVKHRFLPGSGVLTIGTQTTSNPLMATADDAIPWNTDPNVTTGTDVYLIFNGVTVPTGANKLIITSKQRWDVASTTYEMYIRDQTAATWRELTPHGTNFTHDSASSNYDYTQLEVYNGYFSDGSNTAVPTLLSDFVSGSNEVWIRLVSTSTTADLDWDFAQIQFVVDPSYTASGLTVTTGTRANQYSDTYTDDSTSSVTITPSSNTADAYFSFNNVATPPEGFNKVLFDISAHKTTSGSYSISLRNFTTNSWESVANGITRTVDTTEQFLSFDIGDWSNYISNGEMRVQFLSSSSATVLNIDQVRITLGASPGSGTTTASNFGAITNGSSSALGNMDTYNNTNITDPTYYLTLTHANGTSGLSALNGLEGKELEADIPLKIMPGTSPVGLLWMYRAAAGSTSFTFTPTIEDGGGHYRTLATSFKYTLLGANAMPGAADTATLAVAAATYRSGWYVDLVEDLWKNADNRIRFRLYASTAVVAEAKFTVDAVFLSYRWVPSATVAQPESQMRGGKWFNGNVQQKHSF